jgi:hypothetical protein
VPGIGIGNLALPVEENVSPRKIVRPIFYSLRYFETKHTVSILENSNTPLK